MGFCLQNEDSKATRSLLDVVLDEVVSDGNVTCKLDELVDEVTVFEVTIKEAVVIALEVSDIDDESEVAVDILLESVVVVQVPVKFMLLLEVIEDEVTVFGILLIESVEVDAP